MNDMEKIVQHFQNYVKTYTDQPGYRSSSEKTFILDILYGIGISLDGNEYSYRQGLKKFMKEKIQPLINEEC